MWVTRLAPDPGSGGASLVVPYLICTRSGSTDRTAAATRRIPLPPNIRDELIAHKLRSPYSRDHEPIFASRDGTPLSHRNVTRRGFETAASGAGIEGVSFHKLRHAAASRLIEAGLSPVVVAKILGHQDASITLRIYAHLFDRQRTDEAVRLALSDAPS